MTNVNVRRKIEEIMQAEGMNAKTFAEEVGISAGTLSNILGGRNTPRLDVGPMYRKQGIDSPATMELPFDKPLETAKSQPQPAPEPQQQTVIIQKSVQKIAIFYTDGTFEER